MCRAGCAYQVPPTQRLERAVDVHAGKTGPQPQPVRFKRRLRRLSLPAGIVFDERLKVSYLAAVDLHECAVRLLREGLWSRRRVHVFGLPEQRARLFQGGKRLFQRCRIRGVHVASPRVLRSHHPSLTKVNTAFIIGAVGLFSFRFSSQTLLLTRRPRPRHVPASGSVADSAVWRHGLWSAIWRPQRRTKSRNTGAQSPRRLS